jgi:hypothetical protein
MPQSWHINVRGLALLALCVYCSWVTFKTSPGNRLIRCGISTLGVFAALAGLMRLHSVPQWLLNCVGWLLLLLCLLTVVFLFQRAYRAIRRRLWKSY